VIEIASQSGSESFAKTSISIEVFFSISAKSFTAFGVIFIGIAGIITGVHFTITFNFTGTSTSLESKSEYLEAL
jgi:hypothetical protein